MYALLSGLCEPTCIHCQRPYTTHTGKWGHALCPRCQDEIPTTLQRIQPDSGTLTGGWALGTYGSPVGALVRAAKYGGRPGLLDQLGWELAEAFGEERAVDLPTTPFDHILCAPAAFGRVLWRGFDPVEILAKPIATVLGLPLKRALYRQGGQSQASLPWQKRKSNLRGRFDIRGSISGRVLLIDDVRTSGATLEECATVILNAGASEVWGLVAARR